MLLYKNDMLNEYEIYGMKILLNINDTFESIKILIKMNMKLLKLFMMYQNH